MESLLFFVLAAIAVASALLVILQHKPIYSALWLVLCFFSLSGLYFLLHSEFLAIMQIIVYAGAIMVFILFVIMLLNLKGEEAKERLPFQRLIGILFSLLLLMLLVTASVYTVSMSNEMVQAGEISASFGGVKLFGKLLFSEYLLPFEVASVILLIAMIGAVIFGKKRIADREGGPE